VELIALSLQRLLVCKEKYRIIIQLIGLLNWSNLVAFVIANTFVSCLKAEQIWAHKLVDWETASFFFDDIKWDAGRVVHVAMSVRWALNAFASFNWIKEIIATLKTI